MKLLSEYEEYLRKEGYTPQYEDFLCGELINVDFLDQFQHLITLNVEETEEFHEEMEKKMKEQGGPVEYEMDYSNYVVCIASFESTITTEQNFYTGKGGTIHLVSRPGYHTHGLDLFEKCVQLQKLGLVDHELFIMKKRVEHLTWAKEVLIPLLEKADYCIEYSSVFDIVNERRSNSDIDMWFKHYNDSDSDCSFFMATDCLTGEPKFPDGIDLYGKNKEETWNILVEEFWKKAMFPSKYSYLYTEGETKETYREWINEIRLERRPLE